MTVQGEERLFDLERAIDDWIFMCFFVGNDFLPHLPSLDIREQGIDTLINIWRDNFSALGGYVTKDGQVDLAKAQLILMGLARQEDGIFRKRREIEMKKENAAKRRKLNEQRSQETSSFTGNGATAARYMGTKKRGEMIPDVNALPTFAPGDAQTRQDPRYVTHDQMVNKANTANKSAAQVLKESLKKKETASQSQKDALDELMSSVQPADTTQALGKRTADMMEDESSTPGRSTPTNGQDNSQGSQKDPDAMPEDTVRLWEDGYADRYYEQKFHKSPSDIEFRHQVARDYVEGLAWVLHYYSQGPASWTWYYPHHYAPFAADFVDIDKMDLKFEKGKPVRPYEQLMSVMPAASNHTIPSVFHDLMTDPKSDIVDFYPEDFEVDLNGKKFAWQGVALLPFIDNKRLMDAMNTRYHLLTEDERIRNEPGKEVLIFSTQHKLFDEVSMQFYSKKAGVDKLSINPRLSEGLSGKIERNPDYLPSSSLVYPLEGDEMPSLDEDNSISVSYSFPPTKTAHLSSTARTLLKLAKRRKKVSGTTSATMVADPEAIMGALVAHTTQTMATGMAMETGTAVAGTRASRRTTLRPRPDSSRPEVPAEYLRHRLDGSPVCRCQLRRACFPQAGTRPPCSKAAIRADTRAKATVDEVTTTGTDTGTEATTTADTIVAATTAVDTMAADGVTRHREISFST